MRNYNQPMLSEEQMAAYLDGMLDQEEAAYVGQQIDNDPVLTEIQDSIDDVDASYLAYDDAEELPIECLTDDFDLPIIDGYTEDYDNDYSDVDDDYDDYADDYEDGYVDTGDSLADGDDFATFDEGGLDDDFGLT